MFGNSKKTGPESMNGASNQSTGINTIVAGTHAEGTINAKNDLRIDGTIEGTINCTGRLIIGKSGKVNGEAHCENAVIEGNFRGNLTVKDILDVRESANVIGEIKTGKLLVQNGAVFSGNCDMGQKLKPVQKDSATASAS